MQKTDWEMDDFPRAWMRYNIIYKMSDKSENSCRIAA